MLTSSSAVRRSFVIAVLALAVFVASPAKEAQAARAMSTWERSAYKTITYEVLSNGVDLALYGLVLGGTVSASPTFLIINAGTAAATFYAHEVGWARWGPPEADYDSVTLAGKAITYRFANSSRAFMVGLAYSGDPLAAGTFALLGAVADTAVYVYNDWAWREWFPMRQPPEVRSIDIRYVAH